METRTLNKFKNEMQSFKALTITNIAGAGLTMAFAIAYGVGNVIPIITTGYITLANLPYLGLIIAGMVFGINWLTTSAELMSEHDEIMTELEQVSPDDDEAVTGLIVESLALYRENQTKIQKLSLGSRITGAFMLLTCIPQFNALIAGDFVFSGLMALAQVFGFVCTLGLGLVGLYVPTLLKRYTETWDSRLNLSGEVEEKLQRILEGE